MSSGPFTKTEYLLASLSYLLVSAGYVEGVELGESGMEVGSGLSRGIVSDVGRRITEYVAKGKRVDCGDAIGFIGDSSQSSCDEEVIRQFVVGSQCAGRFGSEKVVEAKAGVDSSSFGVDSEVERPVVGLCDDIGSGCSVGYVCELAEVKSAVRGKHYLRNRAKAEKRKNKEKMRNNEVVKDCEDADRGVPKLHGYFSDCSEDVKIRLRESRAEMLIADNVAKKAKAESVTRHLQMVKESRVNETKFELSRQSSEEKLRKISEARLGAGFVEGTVCSSAATPSLSSGSVSPNSSMSMAEVKRKDNLILGLERKLAEVTLEVKSVCADRDRLASENGDLVRREKERRDGQRFRDEVASRYDAPRFVQRYVPGEEPKSKVKGGNGYSQWD